MTMAKPTGAQVAAQALQYAQEKRSYQEMDCQPLSALPSSCAPFNVCQQLTPLPFQFAAVRLDAVHGQQLRLLADCT